MTVKTRIAPSPTGYPHIGTIYQALFNYAFAKRYDGTFLIRIEDTDRTRYVSGAEDVIFQAIDWFGLTEDESVRKDSGNGPYRQSERLAIYHKYAQELVDTNHAYFAYYPKTDAGQKKEYTKAHHVVSHVASEAPPKTITEMIERGDWILRMRVQKDQPVVVKDNYDGSVFRETTFTSDQITEQVLIKSDGFPTYHFAVVVDDHLMGVTHVVRGEEWLSSAPKHVLLYRYFGWDEPFLYHTPLLRNPDKSKLSKRHGHTSVTWYQEEGFLPEAILNFLALMGWTHPEEKELFSLQEFTAKFHLKDIRQVGPVFDVQKLTWMNGEYIRTMPVADLVATIIAYETQFGGHGDAIKQFAPDMLHALVALAQSRISTLKEFYPLIAHFSDNILLTPLSEEQKIIAESVRKAFDELSSWHAEALMAAMKEVLLSHHIRMPVLYSILTGKERGLPLPESLVLLGKEATLARLHKVLS